MTKRRLLFVVVGALALLAAWIVRGREEDEQGWFEAEGEGVVRVGPPVDAPAESRADSPESG